MLNLVVVISNPTGVLFEVKGNLLVLPALDGEMGVLYNHIPLVTSLKFGLMKLFDENKKITSRFYIDGGIAQIDKHRVDIICDECIECDILDQYNLSQKINFLINSTMREEKLEFYKQILTNISDVVVNK